MAEKEQGLTPYISPSHSENAQSFTLSPAQNIEIQTLMRRMLAVEGLGLGPDTAILHSVLSQDALPRGLALAQRNITSLQPYESILGFMQEGLQDRAAIRERARKALAKKSANHQYIGPYAIASLYVDDVVRMESNPSKFLFTPDIKRYTNLANFVAARDILLPEIAQIALAQLQEVFPDVTIETLVTQQQRTPNKDSLTDTQASLVRNALIAHALDLPTPYIAIADLQQLTKTDIQTRFSYGAFSKIAKLFPPSHPEYATEQTSYLSNLFDQVKELLLRAASIQASTEEQHRDSLYTLLRDELLLTPPSLEETPINPWDEGNFAVMQNTKVPTQETIAIMIRQVTGLLHLSRRSSASTERVKLENAKAAWITYVSEYPIWLAKVTRGTENLARYQKLKEDFDSGIQPSYEKSGKLRPRTQEVINATKELRELEEIIRNNKSFVELMQNALPKVVSWLESEKQKNNGVFSDKVALPTFIVHFLQEFGIDQRQQQQGIARGVAKNMTRVLQRDLPNTYDHLIRFSLPIAINDISLSDIEDTLKKVRDYAHAFSADPAAQTPRVDVIKFMQNVTEEIKRMGTLKSSTITSARGKRLVELEEILSYLQKTQSSGITQVNVPREYYLYSLRKRVRALEILARNKKRANLLRNAHKINDTLSKNEAEALLQTLQLHLDSPDPFEKNLFYRGHEAQTAGGFFDEEIVVKLQPDMPSTIPAYQLALGERAIYLDLLAQHRRQTHKPYARLERTGEKLRTMARALTILPPYARINSLTPQQLWQVVYYRGFYLQSLVRYKRATSTIDFVRSKKRDLQRKSYGLNLSNAISNTTEQLERLEVNNPQTAFLMRMQQLGLTTPAN